MAGSISIWQLLIILLIVLVLFGAKKLRTIGSDLGGAVKGFKDAVKDGEKDQRNASAKQEQIPHQDEGRVIDVSAKPAEQTKSQDTHKG